MLFAFGVPAFSWLWVSSTLGAMNLMSSSLTVGWLVLELTDSPFWVGAAAAARGFGQVGFGVFAGVLIDRMEQRRMFVISHLLNATIPLFLGLMVLAGQLTLWHILVASLLQGVFVSLRAPTIDTMAYRIAGPRRMLNASAALLFGFNLARVLASAIAGAFIAHWGVASGLWFSTTCAFAGAGAVIFIKGTYMPPAAPEPFLRAAAQGVKYAWANLPVRRLISLSLIVETFGFSYNVMLPVVARDVLGLDASGLGLLSSMGGAGATLSTLGIASLGDFKHKSRLLLFTVVSSGLFLVLFGLSRWYILSLVLGFLLGAALAAYDVTIKTLFLLIVSDELRGRVQSIYTLTYGFMSVGGLLAGGVATAVGAPFAITVSGAIILAFVMRFLGKLAPSEPNAPVAV
jgi:MFS family permease